MNRKSNFAFGAIVVLAVSAAPAWAAPTGPVVDGSKINVRATESSVLNESQQGRSGGGGGTIGYGKFRLGGSGSKSVSGNKAVLENGIVDINGKAHVTNTELSVDSTVHAVRNVGGVIRNGAVAIGN